MRREFDLGNDQRLSIETALGTDEWVLTMGGVVHVYCSHCDDQFETRVDGVFDADGRFEDVLPAFASDVEAAIRGDERAARSLFDALLPRARWEHDDLAHPEPG